MARSSEGVVVIGLGRFGASLAVELAASDTEVLGIDADPKTVQALAGALTHVVEADGTDEEALRQLSVHEYARAVIGIGANLEASILTASVLRGFQIPELWAKAISHAHARILEQLGVHHVVRPEHDIGRRVAHLVRGRMLDYFEFENGLALVRTRPPEALLGRALSETRLPGEHHVTIIAVKRAGEEEFAHAGAETVLAAGDQIIVSGRTSHVERFSELA